jgi:MtN3 and saliva related transmembrane protein
MIDFITIIGLFAAFLTTISLFPQIVKVWKTKSVKDISIGMFLLMFGSVSIWLIYGLMLNDLPLIASNTLVFVQAITMLTFKIKFSSSHKWE